MPYCAGTGAISQQKESTHIKMMLVHLFCFMITACSVFFCKWVSGNEVEICNGFKYIALVSLSRFRDIDKFFAD